MGIVDKLKGLIGGRKTEVKSGIDKGADLIGDKVGPEHEGKVDMAADKAKDAIDKLPGN